MAAQVGGIGGVSRGGQPTGDGLPETGVGGQTVQQDERQAICLGRPVQHSKADAVGPELD